MVKCDFCGEEIENPKINNKKNMLNNGNYCDKCSNEDIGELYENILEDD